MSLHPMTMLRHSMLRYKMGRLQRYLDGANDARRIQRENLLERIRRHADTAFGRDHGFAEIRTLEDYRRQVPIAGYDAIRPYVDRVIQGETTALFPRETKVVMFATTSGTTAHPKMIPVTEEFYQQYKAGWQYWGTGVYRDYPHLLQMKSLQFSSHWNVTQTPSGAPCGNISGLAAETRPFYIGSLFVLPACVIQITEHLAKHYTALRLSLATDRVGKIVTANPSTLIEVAKFADAMKESLIRDIHDGTLTGDQPIPDAIRQQLRPRLKANPRRARQLQQIADRTGHLYPKDAWPDLTLLAVWTGGSVGIYLNQLPEYYGDVHIRDHGLSASEGRMTVPLQNSTPSGMLDYSSHHFEFIPESQRDAADPAVLEASDLVEGENYFIVLSTASGLYRYDIHDLVRCDGFQGQTPLLSFLNKGKNFCSFTGEKLSEHQVMQAMQQTLQSLGLKSCTFTLAPTLSQRPRYHLVLDEDSLPNMCQQLSSEMQNQLASVNCEYADKCASGRIDPLQVTRVPSGTWEKLRLDKTSKRGNFEEYKHPCLTNDPKFIERLRTLHQ
ncbi:GH3 auxin-responsive promoter family protein [Rhodopirellula sp. JC740]|uniref:GH3 auxin-responsive promoter family protein n=1 Tax=Rhodopirellula halodulae TaxID=2894198 RepID=A0ABS8NP88_9BACT|nr:GH3 auxin-responsive promoter family protein [Rhodopirellula sp. JC740]MCC9645377.1 GH3 auxin-responsive promoter family protein [Rhodopirellula sp. JC740]